jgi:hypothetical protein
MGGNHRDCCFGESMSARRLLLGKPDIGADMAPRPVLDPTQTWGGALCCDARHRDSETCYS